MAKLEDATVKVSVESVVHKALAELVQRIEVEHGFLVQKLAVDWMDASSFSARRSCVASVTVEATSYPDIKP